MSVLETEADAPVAPASATVSKKTASKVASATAVLHDLLVVTWAVPADKLAPLVPAGTILERLPDSEGTLLGFVQLVFALRDDARWSLLPASMGEDFHEITLQVLTRTEQGPSAFVVQHFVDSSQIAASLLPFTQTTEEGRFHVYVAGDPARQTFERIGVKLTTHSVQVHLRGEATETPERTLIGPWHQSVSFLSRLSHQCHSARLPKNSLSVFRTEHPPLKPMAVKLTHQIVRPFDALELGEPLLAFYQAELPLTSLPIRRK
jgi:Uncharacterized conserved protein (COG2071)